MKSIPAVAYYRMSTDRQEDSIPTQRIEVESYASKHGFTIIREYQDVAISGDATEKRKDFQKMIQDATQIGDFKAVLCWDQDRFGRFDPLDAGYWIKPLRDAGIYLATVAQGKIDWEDFGGRIVYAVQQEGKHAYLKDLSRNVARGMLANAKDGKWNGGKPPYGYRVEKQHLVPGDPKDVAIVQWIFKTYVSTSCGVCSITNELNLQGIPAPRGGFWHHTVIRSILRCPFYTGDMVWNRLHEGKYHGIENGTITAKSQRKQKRRPGKLLSLQCWETNPEESWVVKPGTHEALIEMETWNATQKKIQERKRVRHSKKGTFLLTSLAYCANCGRVMIGRMVRHKNRNTSPYVKLTCSGYLSCGRAACGSNTVFESQIVGVILRKIETDFLDPQNLDRLRKEMEGQLTGVETKFHSQQLKSQLEKLDQKIEQGAERILGESDPDLIPLLRGKLQEWQKERASVQAKLNVVLGAQMSIKDAKVKINQAIACLRDLHGRIDRANPDDLRDLLHQTVSRVECWFRQVPFGTKGRMTGVLTRGLIHFRPGQLVVSDGLIGGPMSKAIGETR